MMMTLFAKRIFYSCDVCGSSNFKRIYTFGIFSRRQYVAICRDCGVVCLNPRMTDQMYGEYYTSDYYGQYLPASFIPEDFFGIVKEDSRSKKIYSDLKDLLSRNAKILEVGCGSGQNLVFFMLEGFNNLTGIEPNRDYCKHLNDIGVSCFFALQDLVAKQEEYDLKFDCVILSHVLEHFVEPRKMLALISSLMRNDGILYILAPDFFGHKSAILQFTIPHTYYFSKQTLSRLLVSSGFEVSCFLDSADDEIAILAYKKEDSRDVLYNSKTFTSDYSKVIDHLSNSKGKTKAFLKMYSSYFIELIMNEPSYFKIRKIVDSIRNRTSV